MPSKTSNLYKGFSLIELMLALGLIAVVTAIAIPNLRNFNNTQDVDLATFRFETALKQAQSSAISGVQCPTGEYAQSWQINLNLASATDNYSLVGNCQTSGGSITPRTVSTSNFSTGSGSNQAFSAITDRCGANTNLSIFFTGSQMTYQCASGTVVSTPALKVTISSSNASRSVVIEPGGVIRLE